MRPDSRFLHIALRLGVVVVAAFLVWSGWQAFKVWRAWTGVERLAFDVSDARDALADPSNLGSLPPADPDPDAGENGTSGIPTTDPTTPLPTSPRLDPDALGAYLIIGSDQRAFTGPSQRADVILLFLVPADGHDPILISIPRDLYLENPCTGTRTKINANLNGCGDLATGPELLSIAVEDFTGIEVDHFAVFDFDGFKRVIDRVGGVEICVEHAVFDSHTDPQLSLPAGCSVADGGQTLAWVRSRKTLELRDGVWQVMPGVNDLERNRRQQELLLQALERLKGFRSVSEFSALVEDLAGAFTIDEGLGLADAISLAWDMRDLDPNRIARPEIPVSFSVAPDGASILVPEASFAEVLTEVYPGAADVLAGGNTGR